VWTCPFSSLKFGDLDLKREYKAAVNAVGASNTIARVFNVSPTGFVVYFVVDRLEK